MPESTCRRPFSYTETFAAAPGGRRHTTRGSGGTADALASGASPSNRVGVQIPASAPFDSASSTLEHPAITAAAGFSRPAGRAPSAGPSAHLEHRRHTDAHGAREPERDVGVAVGVGVVVRIEHILDIQLQPHVA